MFTQMIQLNKLSGTCLHVYAHTCTHTHGHTHTSKEHKPQTKLTNTKQQQKNFTNVEKEFVGERGGLIVVGERLGRLEVIIIK